tara:strand:- start:129 stop:836 length:708 start_codon:yes stop_codon:yes gene_type:complete
MKTEGWRYERKFFIENYSKAEVINSIMQHPSIFKAIFQSRQVNNIYFDSFGFKYYIANVEGETEREKVRIRWYGERLGKVENPMLEFKIKRGHLGRKEYYPLNTFYMDEKNGSLDLLNMMQQATLPPRIQNDIRLLLPCLANSYMRQYFLSSDKRFRLTVDTNIRIFELDHIRPAFREQHLPCRSIVMELKYSSSEEDDFDAREVANRFRFRSTKNSKYVGGVDEIYSRYSSFCL